MKKEYDFSKGEREKFYNPRAKINLPIYLEPENHAFVENIAKKKHSDLTTVVNELIKSLNSKKYEIKNEQAQLTLFEKESEYLTKRRDKQRITK